MKSIVFLIGLVIVLYIALKVLFWTLAHAIYLAAVIGVIYLIVRYFTSKSSSVRR
jgi:hypothetical protein